MPSRFNPFTMSFIKLDPDTCTTYWEQHRQASARKKENFFCFEIWSVRVTMMIREIGFKDEKEMREVSCVGTETHTSNLIN